MSSAFIEIFVSVLKGRIGLRKCPKDRDLRLFQRDELILGAYRRLQRTSGWNKMGREFNWSASRKVLRRAEMPFMKSNGKSRIEKDNFQKDVEV